MSEEVSAILNLVISLLGAFFIAATVFKKFGKVDINYLKLAGFLLIFFIGFVALVCATFYINSVPFSR